MDIRGREVGASWDAGKLGARHGDGAVWRRVASVQRRAHHGLVHRDSPLLAVRGDAFPNEGVNLGGCCDALWWDRALRCKDVSRRILDAVAGHGGGGGGPLPLVHLDCLPVVGLALRLWVGWRLAVRIWRSLGSGPHAGIRLLLGGREGKGRWPLARNSLGVELCLVGRPGTWRRMP